jgi:hypothetical protein
VNTYTYVYTYHLSFFRSRSVKDAALNIVAWYEDLSTAVATCAQNKETIPHSLHEVLLRNVMDDVNSLHGYVSGSSTGLTEDLEAFGTDSTTAQKQNVRPKKDPRTLFNHMVQATKVGDYLIGQGLDKLHQCKYKSKDESQIEVYMQDALACCMKGNRCRIAAGFYLGRALVNCRELYGKSHKGRRFIQFVRDCGFKESKSWMHKLMNVYNFCTDYPKTLHCTVGIRWLANNVKPIIAFQTHRHTS